MGVNQYNKILSPQERTPTNEELPEGLLTVGADETESDTEIGVVGFQNPISPEDMADMIFLGAGPHEKARGLIRVSPIIPSRPMVNTGTPEYFMTYTTAVYWNSTWANASSVLLQADDAGNLGANTLFGLAASGITVEWTISGKYSATGSTTGASAVKTINLNSSLSSPTTPFTTGGTGFYTITVKVKSSSPSTTCSMTTPMYLNGVASYNSVWAGIPTIDGSGKISYDMTVQFPDVSGVEDYDVEVAEV
jgi:hypothetical protein